MTQSTDPRRTAPSEADFNDSPTSRRLAVKGPRDVAMALRHVRAVCSSSGFHPLRRSLAIVATHELAHNIVQYTGGGAIELGVSPDRSSLRILAKDCGPGIEHAEALLHASLKPKASGLGGLGIVQNVATVFEFHSSPSGTTVAVTINMDPKARGKGEVGRSALKPCR
ncbi:MAG: hypothetical protein OEZ06_13740 [Myxococcales bacterium]|nr:hypothetical protein [Myxococcales bacterium]